MERNMTSPSPLRISLGRDKTLLPFAVFAHVTPLFHASSGTRHDVAALSHRSHVALWPGTRRNVAPLPYLLFTNPWASGYRLTDEKQLKRCSL